jgi:uncharacterized protein YbjT (DUF2867 family)
MRYVIMGGAGNVARPLVMQLLSAGHQVTVISRQIEHVEELVKSGATSAIGSLEDQDFLNKTLSGADAVFTLCPVNFQTEDIKSYYEQLGRNYAAAIKANNIRNVVNLSSVGAHLSEGAGPVSGLYRTERVLNELEEVHILHLRPVYFYTNFFAAIEMVKSMGVMGDNFSLPPNKFPMAHPADVAMVAAVALQNLDFRHHSVRYVASDERGTDEIAAVLGNAIGKPKLKWVKFSDEQVLQALLRAGIPKHLAAAFTELGKAIDRQDMFTDYWKCRTGIAGKSRLEDFAKEWSTAFLVDKERVHR